MKCVEDLILHSYFPFGKHATDMNVIIMNDQFIDERSIWLDKILQAIDRSDDISEFGINNKKITNIYKFAKKFEEITGVSTSSYFELSD